MKNFYFLVVASIAPACTNKSSQPAAAIKKTSQIEMANGTASENPLLAVESDGSLKLLNGDPRSVVKLHQITLLASNGEIAGAKIQPLPLTSGQNKAPLEIDVELSDGSRCKGASDSEQIGYKLSCRKGGG